MPAARGHTVSLYGIRKRGVTLKLGFLIYGSLETLSGGYLYDRQLVAYLRAQGDDVRMISLPWRNYGLHLSDNLTFRLPAGLDILIQDELNHPSLLAANRAPHPYPVVSLVHHLRCSERRLRWQNALYRIVERRYLRSVDGFIFNSQTTRGVVAALVGDDRPGIVAYPPTDRFGLTLPEADIRARAESGPLRMLFLGNVIPRKGLHTLLQALGQLPVPDYQLDVVGSLSSDPAYARQMQELASLHPNSPRAGGQLSTVHFHGALDNIPLVEKLKAAHVLVVPSSYEGFGIVYLEGMAFGLPAIGTSAGAAGEIIRDGQNGYLVSPEDAGALAERLSALATDRDLLARLSLNALKRYREQPTWEQTAAEIRTFLLGMINKHAAH
jgi:glycosyltransferase involved in cell wall biosynthesis